MAYTQDGRLIAISTSLPADTLLLQGFTGTEAISRPFSFQLDLLSEDAALAATDIIGKAATITLTLADDSQRYLNGFISRFAQAEADTRVVHYRAEMVPWLWFLTRTADCRIFQNMTVPDIITKVFDDLGFSDYKNNLPQGSFEPRDYCVQYRETDFNFVSRLMEQYGIFYFFEHEEKKHTLVLANSASAHQPCPKQPKAPCEFTGGVVEEGLVTAWHMEHELRPGRYALSDFNFETPTTRLESSVDTTISVGGNSRFELFDYPGIYPKKNQGEQLAKIRMEEEEAAYLVARGASTCRGFVSGYRFELADHYRRDVNTAYVLTEIRHTASAGSAYTTGGAVTGEQYSNEFICMPHTVPYRPPRNARKPFVQGVQTAIVVGPSGEEIYTDKYGRVKVQFHWDRKGTKNEKSSCWVRVAQSWAGKGWGAIFLPRIGQEVIVDFLEGDPDQPIIVGSVYNAQDMPPYALPDEKTKSTIKSNSSKGGGGFNEIRFEDKKGEELLFVHAEKDEDVVVKHDAREWIGNDRHLIVKKNQLEAIEGDKHGSVTGKHLTKVGGDAGSKIAGNWNVDAGAKISIKAGADIHEKAGANYALEAGAAVHVKAGATLVIEAGAQLSLKVGGNFIDINPGGIFIQGTMVNINSGGSAGSGSGSSPTAPEEPKAPTAPKEAADT